MSELIAELREHERDYPSLVHGPLCGLAADRIEELVTALEFYADPKRYLGANQRNDADDPYSEGAPYIKDVGRDGGGIAREALSRVGIQRGPGA